MIAQRHNRFPHFGLEEKRKPIFCNHQPSARDWGATLKSSQSVAQLNNSSRFCRCCFSMSACLTKSPSMDSKLIRSTAIWYLICVLLFTILADLGRNSGSEIVYHYGDSRDHWWAPSNLMLTLVIVWIIPLPHQVIALAFKSKRNLVSQVKIFRKWMTVLAITGICLLSLGTLSSIMSTSKLLPS